MTCLVSKSTQSSARTTVYSARTDQDLTLLCHLWSQKVVARKQATKHEPTQRLRARRAQIPLAIRSTLITRKMLTRMRRSTSTNISITSISINTNTIREDNRAIMLIILSVRVIIWIIQWDIRWANMVILCLLCLDRWCMDIRCNRAWWLRRGWCIQIIIYRILKCIINTITTHLLPKGTQDYTMGRTIKNVLYVFL